mgnify:FL=1
MAGRWVPVSAMDAPTDSAAISIVDSSTESYTRRTVTVDFLYLDTESCDRCIGTEAALETALERVAPILDVLDVEVVVRDIHVSTLAAAEATQLAVSPTIRINGQDIQPDYLENTCDSCGDLCACSDDVDCRLWRYRGEEHTAAPVGLLVEALTVAIVSPQPSAVDASDRQTDGVSANVRAFFEDPETDDTSCGCEC